MPCCGDGLALSDISQLRYFCCYIPYSMRIYYLRISLLLLASAAIYQMLAGRVPSEWYYSDFLWVPLFIATVSVVLHRGLVQRMHDNKLFIRYYMGSTGMKLFLYLSILIVYGVLLPEKLKGFALCFFFFYFVFTALEVSTARSSFGTTQR